jgi:hypothetical protein
LSRLLPMPMSFIKLAQAECFRCLGSLIWHVQDDPDALESLGRSRLLSMLEDSVSHEQGGRCSDCLSSYLECACGSQCLCVRFWSQQLALGAREIIWGGSNFILVLESCRFGSSRVRLPRESFVWQEHAALMRTRSN